MTFNETVLYAFKHHSFLYFETAPALGFLQGLQCYASSEQIIFDSPGSWL